MSVTVAGSATVRRRAWVGYLKQSDIVFGFRRFFFVWGGSWSGFKYFSRDGTREDFHFLFCVGEAISAGFHEPDAFLVTGQKFFKRQFGIFHF